MLQLVFTGISGSSSTTHRVGTSHPRIRLYCSSLKLVVHAFIQLDNIPISTKIPFHRLRASLPRPRYSRFGSSGASLLPKLASLLRYPHNLYPNPGIHIAVNLLLWLGPALHFHQSGCVLPAWSLIQREPPKRLPRSPIHLGNDRSPARKDAYYS